MSELIEAVEEVLSFAWHSRECHAIDADGEWHIGNKECSCGYTEAREKYETCLSKWKKDYTL